VQARSSVFPRERGLVFGGGLSGRGRTDLEDRTVLIMIMILIISICVRYLRCSSSSCMESVSEGSRCCFDVFDERHDTTRYAHDTTRAHTRGERIMEHVNMD
jgi:hypothetical protein